MMNRAMQLHWFNLFNEDDECRLVSNNNDNEVESCNSSRQKGGYPVGSSITSKYEIKLSRVKVHNNISVKYALEKRYILCSKRLPRGRLEEMIDDVTSKQGLNFSNI